MSRKKQGRKAGAQGKQARRMPSWRMKLALCLFGTFVGLVILTGAELALRLLGVARPAPLFIPLAEEDGRLLVMNNQLFPLRFFFRRYEGRYAGVGETNLQVFWVPKPADMIRILLIGESSIQGFPHQRNLNSASFLRAYLRDLLPGKRVDVINLGTTALASFAVSKVLEEASEAAPDAIIAYLGHNEFFGAYGVASLMRAASGPVGCRLHYGFRQLRLAQLLLGSGKPEVTEKDLMEFMAAIEYLPAGDSLRAAAYANLKANLEAMAETARQWGVPFIVGTLVSNEKDLDPVRSLPAPGDEGEGRFRKLLDEGSRSSLEEAERAFPESASLWHRKGKLSLAEGRFEEARAFFQRAIDLDAMPWRATSRANEIIRSIAKKPGVFLADVEDEFRKRSPNGILGDELLLDHVHPDTEGQGLMARSFAAALGRALPDLKLDLSRLEPISHYRELLGECPATRFHLILTMGNLFSKDPLAKQNGERVKRLRQQAKKLFSALHPASRAAYEAWRKLPRGMAQRPLVMVCADAFTQGKPDLAEAARLFRASIEGTPPYTPLRLEAMERTVATGIRVAGHLADADRELAREGVRMADVLLKTSLADRSGVLKLRGELEALAKR